MPFDDKKQKLDRLLKLIKTGNAGDTKELCDTIFVSRRTLQRYIDELRKQGYLISFCTKRKSYYLICDNMILQN
jgi:predicted DNA-binding transcriptional regulator YafY